VRPKAASSLPIASPDLPTRTLPKHPAPLVSARQARGTWRVASPRCLRARAPYRPRLPSNSIRPRPISAHSRFRHAEVTQQLTSARDHAEARVLEAFAEAERRVEEAMGAAAEHMTAAESAAEERLVRAESARQALEEKCKVQAEVHAGQAAVAAHQMQALEAAKREVERTAEEERRRHAEHLATLKAAHEDEASSLQRMAGEHMQQKVQAEEEADEIAEQLEVEREKRAVLQTMHEKETTTLRQALHKATGFKETKQREELLRRAAAKFRAGAVADADLDSPSPLRAHVRSNSTSPGLARTKSPPPLSASPSPSSPYPQPPELVKTPSLCFTSKLISSPRGSPSKSPTSPRLKSSGTVTSSTGRTANTKLKKAATSPSKLVAGSGPGLRTEPIPVSSLCKSVRWARSARAFKR